MQVGESPRLCNLSIWEFSSEEFVPWCLYAILSLYIPIRDTVRDVRVEWNICIRWVFKCNCVARCGVLARLGCTKPSEFSAHFVLWPRAPPSDQHERIWDDQVCWCVLIFRTARFCHRRFRNQSHHSLGSGSMVQCVQWRYHRDPSVWHRPHAAMTSVQCSKVWAKEDQSTDLQPVSSYSVLRRRVTACSASDPGSKLMRSGLSSPSRNTSSLEKSRLILNLLKWKPIRWLFMRVSAGTRMRRLKKASTAWERSLRMSKGRGQEPNIMRTSAQASYWILRFHCPWLAFYILYYPAQSLVHTCLTERREVTK